MPEAKTHSQIQRLFGLAKVPAQQAGWDTKEFLEDLASQVTNGQAERLSALTFDQANAMIRRLGGQPIVAAGSQTTARRTVNHRRKKGGVPQIVSAAQLKLLNDLAAGRKMTDAGLKNLCNTMIKKPSPRTTAEANKMIEAIKAMNKRDALYGGKRTQEAA